MKIYIIRHGQIPHNVNTIDEDLIEIGIEQAKELKEKIENINFDIIICFIRAKHTAEIIMDQAKVSNCFLKEFIIF